MIAHDEFKRMWKEAVTAYFKQMLGGIDKNISWDSQSLKPRHKNISWDSQSLKPRYKPRIS
jgi:hypothetical protein